MHVQIGFRLLRALPDGLRVQSSLLNSVIRCSNAHPAGRHHTRRGGIGLLRWHGNIGNSRAATYENSSSLPGKGGQDATGKEPTESEKDNDTNDDTSRFLESAPPLDGDSQQRVVLLSIVLETREALSQNDSYAHGIIHGVKRQMSAMVDRIKLEIPPGESLERASRALASTWDFEANKPPRVQQGPGVARGERALGNLRTLNEALASLEEDLRQLLSEELADVHMSSIQQRFQQRVGLRRRKGSGSAHLSKRSADSELALPSSMKAKTQASSSKGRLLKARDEATSYAKERQSWQVGDQEDESGNRAKWETLEDIEAHVEEQILIAQADGAFDNLEGKGKPIARYENIGSQNPFLDDTDRYSFNLAQRHGFAPDWVMKQRQIRESMDKARARLGVAMVGKGNPNGGWGRWLDAKKALREEIKKVNRMVRDHNLICPSSTTQIQLFSFEDELAAVQAGKYPLSPEALSMAGAAAAAAATPVVAVSKVSTKGLWGNIKAVFASVRKR